MKLQILQLHAEHHLAENHKNGGGRKEVAIIGKLNPTCRGQ